MKKSMIVAIIVAAIAVPAGVYAASPLFINTTIDELIPVAGDKMMEDKEDTMMEKELSGIFAGAGDGVHNAEGVAKVIHLEGESDVLRLEDFRVTNGPDLYIYLATDKQASDFVDLGRLKANSGNQNYDMPEGVDLAKYDTVVVWCKAFSVFFGGAELTSMSA